MRYHLSQHRPKNSRCVSASLIVRCVCSSGRPTCTLIFILVETSVRLGAAVRVNKPILLDVPAAVFTGNLYIVDTRGLGVYPDYSGLGSRWKLAYVFDDGVIVEEPKE